MKRIIILTTACLLMSLSTSISGQSEFKGYLSVGAGGGTNIFFGDLKQKDFFPVSENKNEWRFGGSAYLQYHVSPVFSIRGQGLYGEVSGTKRDLNRYFDATVLEGNFNAVVNFSNWFGQYNPARFLSVYGFVGIGMTNYKSDLRYLSNDQPISEDKDNDGIIGPHYAGTVPGGLGLMFK
ncbi:MAG: porin family protein, partial [Bacteroidales bacterium]|nr:porin family protein [Bacteroidales bacterium]